MPPLTLSLTLTRCMPPLAARAVVVVMRELCVGVVRLQLCGGVVRLQ